MENKEATSSMTQAVITTRTMEMVVAVVVFIFGAIFAYSSYNLGFRWGIEGPQSGYFPFYISLFICGASIVVFLQALFTKGEDATEAFVERKQLKQVVSVTWPMAAFVLGVQLVGTYAASAIYIFLFMRLLGKYSWLKSALLGLGISVAFFFMFEVWFEVALYKGYWDLTGWTGF